MIATLRRVALGVALFALLGIGLRPTHRVAVSVTEAVLVTPGADPNDGAVRHLADSLHATVYAGAEALRRAHPAARRLHVVGWGLEAEQWRDLDSIPLVGHAAGLPPGIRSVSWPAEVVLGDRLIVEGALAGASQIALRDPAGLVVDSAPVRADGAFRLTAVPRAVGQHRYTLQGETLGVTVIPPPTWRVLVLEATPSFETSALRDWLARAPGKTGGSVALRTTVSRDRIRTEFVNLERVALAPVNGRLLDRFDVVIIDGRTLAGLPGSERGALRQAIERGLGVLIVPDTALFDLSRRFPDREFFFGFTPVRIPDLDVRLVRPSWPEARGGGLTVSVPAAPYYLAPRFGVATTMVDGSGATLAQVAPRGAGRVGVSLVTGAARWRRAGEAAAFAGYWSRLLSVLGTGSRNMPRWSVETPGPWFVDHPVTIAVFAHGSIPVTIVTGPGGARDSVFLAPDPLEPARQRGVFWPREPGWYAMADGGGAGFYAQSNETWISRQATERRAATARHAVAVGNGVAGFASDGTPASRETRRPISPLWFFAAFLLALGILWSARRPVRSGQVRGGTPIR